MSEARIMREIQLAATKLGWRMFRNNTGVLIDRTGRPVRFGLAVGSSDLIGIGPWVSGSGVPSGRFTAIEVKRPGQHPTPEQQAFIDMVNDMDGIAFVAHSVEEAVKCLRSRLNR